MAYDILHRVGIGAPVDKVFETLTTLEGNRAWWDANATGDARKGGVLTFFNSHDMKVVEATPGELVKWKITRGCKEWVDTEISFQLVRRQERSSQAAMVLHLAEQIWIRERGAPPPNLEALVGPYLERLPDDGSSELDDGTTPTLGGATTPSPTP